MSTVPVVRRARTPRSVRRITRATFGVLAVLPVVLMLVPWRQTVIGKGRVVALAPVERQQVVEARIYGRITAWQVREGSRVQVGDVLATITDNDPLLLARLDEQRALKEAKLQAVREKLAAYAAKIEALRSAQRLAEVAADQTVLMVHEKKASAEQSVHAAVAAERTAQIQRVRYGALRDEQIVSQRDLEVAELKHDQAVAYVEKARAELRGAERGLDGKKASRSKVTADFEAKVQSEEASLRAARGEVAEAQAAVVSAETKLAKQSTQVVTAPTAGTVLRLEALLGTYVKAGSPLAVIVPDTDAAAVELWVDGNDMPLVSAGRQVRLQLEGWPAVQFSGWPSVAVGTFAGEVTLVDATDDGSGRFRLVIVPVDGEEPWPTSRYLRQGVRAKGWILLEQVTLGYELWRQLNGFPPALTTGDDPYGPSTKGRSKKSKGGPS